MKKRLIPVLLICGLLAGLLSGCGASSEGDTSAIEAYDLLKHQQFTAEENSEDMLTQIAATAEVYAEELTEEEVEHIYDILIQSNHEFYDGNNQMELYLWLGELLQAKYEETDARAQLGASLTAAVTDVYLGAEDAESDATEALLAEVDTSLEAAMALAEE